MSGHYSPVDVWEVAKSLRSRGVIPVHTRDPLTLAGVFSAVLRS
ncbi:hypothetical protein [Infirmifilum lucidum]|nr:hypothetical protein [Infirmifilum lucidum]